MAALEQSLISQLEPFKKQVQSLFVILFGRIAFIYVQSEAVIPVAVVKSAHALPLPA